MPDFEAFRGIFLSCLPGVEGCDLTLMANAEWSGIGPVETRKDILEAVRNKVLDQYGVDFEINHRLLAVDGTVESAVVQTFHELNTIYLMERINAKIRAKQN